MGGLHAKLACTTMFQRAMGIKEGEKHHFERRIVKMETIMSLCANKKTSHKYHAKGA
jgi:hypothetical protein